MNPPTNTPPVQYEPTARTRQFQTDCVLALEDDGTLKRLEEYHSETLRLLSKED